MAESGDSELREALEQARRTEASLRAQLAQLREILDHVPAWIAATNSDLRYVAVNQYYEEAFGIPREQIEGRYFGDVFPALVDRHHALCERCLAGETVVWDDVLTADPARPTAVHGVYRPLRGPDGVVRGLTSIALDVTDRHNAEQALRRSEKFFRTVAASLPNGAIDIIGRDGRFIFADGEEVRRSGASLEQRIGQTCVEALGEVAGRAAWEGVQPAFGGQPVTFEVAFPERGHYLLSAVPLPEPDGSIDRVLVLVVNITAQRRLEERLETVIRTLPDGLAVVDSDTLRFREVNDTLSRMTGWSREELLGMTVPDVVAPESREQVVRSATGVPRAGTVRRSARTRCKNGRTFESDIAAAYLPGTRQQVAIIRDMTESRQLQAEALKAQKLESLGVLAGGIAHDFNNLLMAILGNVSLAREAMPAGATPAVRLGEAERAVLRAQDLTRQLLTFARGGAPMRRPSSLAAIVQESATFVLSGSNVRSEIRADEDLWPADVDPGQVGQVVQNLVVNAMQAMPAGGTVQISLHNTVVDGPGDPDVAPGRYIRIEVRDTGVGIPESIADRILEPYFSTKNRGSGLGLSVSYSIVRNHGGTLGFESAPGQGTVFRVLFPAAAEPAASSPPAPARRTAGQGRILVMDDEAMVRDVLVAMLVDGGYDAAATADGAEAVEAWSRAAEDGRPFDAVLVDLTVPGGIGGLETLHRLQQLDPAVRVIVSSGYSNAPILADYRRYGFRGVAPKPFRLSDLHAVVAEVLAGRNV